MKGTPSYWKQLLYDLLAMVKQLGIPAFPGILQWDELTSIIHKLNNFTSFDDYLKNLTYEERCKYLNSNPVLAARHFQFKVEVFFQKILFDGQLGKLSYHIHRVEFQVRGIPHIHSFIWIQNAPNMTPETEEESIQFVEKLVSAKLPDPVSESELYEHVKAYQIHTHSRTCRKYKKKDCRFNYDRFFSGRTILAKPLTQSLNLPEKKNQILPWLEGTLTKVK